MQAYLISRVYVCFSKLVGFYWMLFLASFLELFFIFTFACARTVMLMLQILATLNISIYWLAKGKYPDIVQYSTKIVANISVSMLVVMQFDIAIFSWLVLQLSLQSYFKAVGILWGVLVHYGIITILLCGSIYIFWNQEKEVSWESNV